MINLFGFEHLIENENKSIESTNLRILNIDTAPREMIDILLQIRYYYGDSSGTKHQGGLDWFCASHYNQAPYTFRSINILLLKGYYLECLILIRHLFEAFGRMRYFLKFPEQFEPFMKNEKNVFFKNIFDTFSPNLHKIYKEQLCEAAHGCYLKDIFRINREHNPKRLLNLDSNFDPLGADYVTFWIKLLFIAFLKYFPIFFPKNSLNSNLDLESRRIYSIKQTRNLFKDKLENNIEIDDIFSPLKLFILD